VWFVSDAPTGPWAVADKIPDVIYTIPPNSPLYRVRFVYIYGSTPDYVYFGYTPGYLGSFPRQIPPAWANIRISMQARMEESTKRNRAVGMRGIAPAI
jgi:hypothetical protein